MASKRVEMYWVPWDGNYEKYFYILKDKTGKIHECWPNAGIMNSLTDDTQFKPEDEVEVWLPIEEYTGENKCKPILN